MAAKWSLNRGILHQYIAGFAACLSVVTSGSMFGWITPLLSHLLGPDSEIPMTESEANWVVSIMELGNFLSPLPAAYLANRIGRKPVLLATGPLYIITWIIILWWPSVPVLSTARVCQGLIMGLSFTAGPVYLGEIASDSTRGAVTSLFFNSWWVGLIISYTVGPLLDFRGFTIFTLLLNLPFILVYFWQPESPYYYMMTGNFEKAEESLKWLRDSSPEELKEELEAIRNSVDEDMRRSTGIKDLVATPADRKAFALLMAVTAVRISSGTGALLVYATQVFKSTPNLSISPDIITISLGGVMLIGGIVNSLSSDSLGRRPLLLISSFGCLICTFLTGTYYLILSEVGDTSEIAHFSWLAPVLILLYASLCSAGMYPVCTSYTSELFPSNTRGLASSFGSTNCTLFSFITMSLYLPITGWLGLYANFYLYSATTFLGFVYFYFAAPETKGKSFVEIRKELCGNSSLSTI